MEGKGAQEAIRERLRISLSKEQSGELYNHLCNFLVTTDEFAFVDLLKTKYDLLHDGVSLLECDYLIMESLLEQIESGNALALAAITYMVQYKS